MINIKSRIDEKLSIYREHVIVIWGAGTYGKHILELLEKVGIKVYAVCDNNEKLWGGDINGIEIISPRELKLRAKGIHNILIQIAIGRVTPELMKQIEKLNVSTWISYGEASTILSAMLQKRKMLTSSIHNGIEEQRNQKILKSKKKLYEDIKLDENEDILLICMPGKTGDYTIEETLTENKVRFFNLWHRAEKFDFKLITSKYKKVKIVTAVREPVSQYLSAMFQHISIQGIAPEVEFADLGIMNNTELLYKNGGDVQEIFNHYMHHIVNDYDGKIWQQIFLDSFSDHIIDLMEYSYNQVKGYTIVKEGNIEIFVFQLEKLDGLVSEFSDWLNVPITSWKIGNEGTDKWTGDAYQQAVREIKVTQEFFELCYSQHFVKCFYSDEDIIKFKERWKSHIM